MSLTALRPRTRSRVRPVRRVRQLASRRTELGIQPLYGHRHLFQKNSAEETLPAIIDHLAAHGANHAFERVEKALLCWELDGFHRIAIASFKLVEFVSET